MLWILGGLDPTAGAGVLRDVLTAETLAPSLPTRTFLTAWTRQGHGRPAEAWPVDETTLRRQLDRAPVPTAVKVGMVPSTSVPVVLDLLAAVGAAPWVVDPVLRASDGGVLSDTPEALEPLLRRATLITPNLDEARRLGGGAGTAESIAWTLHRRYGVGVLVKGGHDLGEHVVDHLVVEGGSTRWSRPRRPGPDLRGTGCALATAIAVGLASHRPLQSAVGDAIAWLDARRAGLRG